jgi:hypothetical protein
LVLSHMQGEALNLPKMIPVHFDDYGVFASPLSDFIELERSATVSI